MMITMEISDRIWMEFENLLEEAVENDHDFAVERLLGYEEGNFLANVPKYKAKSFKALILAIEKQNVIIIKIFRKYHYTLPEPHVSNCRCNNCRADKLGTTKYRLTLLKALSNPIWISLVSDDPFLTLFDVCHMNKTFAGCDDGFKKTYKELYQTNVDLFKNLLDEVRSQKEGATLMKHKTICKDDACGDLTFIILAVEYKQKEVVAHPVLQHFLTSVVFDDIPGWQTSGIAYKIFLVVFVSLIYPLTTVVSILCPPRWSSSIGEVAMKPFIKFINVASSFITFLALLAVLGSSEREGVRNGVLPPTGIEIVVFVWLIGFCFGEIMQLYKNGIRRYFSNGWNWVDVGMDVLMVFSFLAWAIVCSFEDHDHEDYTHLTILHIADGTFTVGIILSFFRIIYLCQITSYLGLLQLCLREMMLVILQFAFITIIVLLAFTVGMVFLFNASVKGKLIRLFSEHSHENHTAIFETFSENFNGFGSTLFTMIYVSLTMQGTETLEDFADGTLVQLWANLLFICYYGITMIVVINMLIAMMNSSYQNIADNLDMEHLYSRTTLWLEYIGDEQTRPVPFNLIPKGKWLFYMMKKVFTSSCCKDTSGKDQKELERQRKKYKKVCGILMERYMARHGLTKDLTLNQVRPKSNDSLLIKIHTHFETWKQMVSDGPADTSTAFSQSNDNMGFSDENDSSDVIQPYRPV